MATRMVYTPLCRVFPLVGPDGEIPVITECGGAMERSQCPECGSEIGGGSHRLLENNTRDLDMQALAREAGARNEDYWAPR
jgi:hypothetical protein